MIGINFRWAAPSRASLAETCQKTVDIALVASLVLTALALGGRHDLGRFVYVATVAVAVLATIGQKTLSKQAFRTPLGPTVVLVAGLLCVFAQLVPLPASLLAVVAPGHTWLLPVWAGGGVLDAWSTVSLTPAETVEGLCLLLTHGLLFFVIAERVQSERDILRVLGGVAAAAAGMAVVAILQKASPSERLLWFYDYPSRSFDRAVQGAFANRNHLAQLLAIGAAALTPFVFAAAGLSAKPNRRRAGDASKKVVRLAAGVSLGVVLVVLLATQSRGGAAAMAAATLVAAAVHWCGGRLGLSEVIKFVAVGAVALGGVSFFGYEEVTSRLDDLVSGQIEDLDADSRRRLIWAANTKAFLANPWLGHGAGSHRDVYPAYIDEASAKEFTHAESGYLQIASENGLAGLLVLAVAITMCVRWVVLGALGAESATRVALWAALGAGLTASFVHSVVDFVWYVPVLCALAVTLAACAMRLHQMQAAESFEAASPQALQEPSAMWWRSGLAVTAAGFAVMCLWGPASGAVSWDRYLRASKTVRGLEAKLFSEAVNAQSDPHLIETIDAGALRAVDLLEVVTRCDPQNARAHARLAGRLLQHFERTAAQGGNPMSVEMIAGAVSASGFESEAAVREWLIRAFGGSARLLARARLHAEQAVRLDPLQGEAYLQLASLSFLDGEPASIEPLVEQAVRVRPLDGQIRFEAGRQKHLAGAIDEAFEHYRASIRLPGSHRIRLIASLCRVLPAVEFIKQLRPDCAATDLVLAAYRQNGTEEDLVAIAEHAESESEAEGANLSARDASRRWRQVSEVNRSLERFEKAIECATRAYELTPYDFRVRHELAFALYQAERLAEADPHFRWCLARRPDLRYLQQSLQDASKRRAANDWKQRLAATLAKETSEEVADAGTRREENPETHIR